MQTLLVVATLPIPIARIVTGYIKSDIRYYTDSLIDVPWQAVLALRYAVPRAGVVLLGDDSLSKASSRVIAHFINRNQLRAPIVATRAIEGAQELAVSLVPQIRVYDRGVEIKRHHGLASYSILSNLFESLK